MPGMAFMPSSTGTVISRSTSSAEWPGHCVTMSTIGGDRFGYASIGSTWYDHTPAAARPSASSTISMRCCSAKATMRLTSEAGRGGGAAGGVGALIGSA